MSVAAGGLKDLTLIKNCRARVRFSLQLSYAVMVATSCSCMLYIDARRNLKPNIINTFSRYTRLSSRQFLLFCLWNSARVTILVLTNLKSRLLITIFMPDVADYECTLITAPLNSRH